MHIHCLFHQGHACGSHGVSSASLSLSTSITHSLGSLVSSIKGVFAGFRLDLSMLPRAQKVSTHWSTKSVMSYIFPLTILSRSTVQLGTSPLQSSLVRPLVIGRMLLQEVFYDSSLAFKRRIMAPRKSMLFLFFPHIDDLLQFFQQFIVVSLLGD